MKFYLALRLPCLEILEYSESINPNPRHIFSDKSFSWVIVITENFFIIQVLLTIWFNGVLIERKTSSATKILILFKAHCSYFHFIREVIEVA